MIGQYWNAIPGQVLSLGNRDFEDWAESFALYPGKRHVMLSCQGSLRWSLSVFDCFQIQSCTPTVLHFAVS